PDGKWIAGCGPNSILVKVEPLGAGPKKAKPGLDGRAKALLAGGQFAQEQGKIKRHNPPHQRQVLEGGSNQPAKDRKIVLQCHARIKHNQSAGRRAMEQAGIRRSLKAGEARGAGHERRSVTSGDEGVFSLSAFYFQLFLSELRSMEDLGRSYCPRIAVAHSSGVWGIR